MSPVADRAVLAAQQAELMLALAGDAPAPPGFDTERLHATATALARKRARSAARAWPDLDAALGEKFNERFAEYASQQPLPGTGGPLADGRAFVDFLTAQGALPDEGRIEALRVDLHHVRTPRGLRPRRGPACKMALLRSPLRLVMALRIPWLGERWLTITMPG